MQCTWNICAIPLTVNNVPKRSVYITFFIKCDSLHFQFYCFLQIHSILVRHFTQRRQPLISFFSSPFSLRFSRNLLPPFWKIFHNNKFFHKSKNFNDFFLSVASLFLHSLKYTFVLWRPRWRGRAREVTNVSCVISIGSQFTCTQIWITWNIFQKIIS